MDAPSDSIEPDARGPAAPIPDAPPHGTGVPRISSFRGAPGRPDVPALAASEVRRRRLSAFLVFAAAAVLLGVAWGLPPAERGFGTHQALGLPACSWPARFGIPCPSCGMTTAFALAAKGRILASFATQPAGCILAIATGMALAASAWTLATGRTFWPVYERLWGARLAWIAGVVVLLSWGYKAASMGGWLNGA